MILHIAGLIGVAIGAAVVGSIGGKLATVFLVLNIFAMLFMVVFSLSCGVAIMVATSNNLRRVQAWPISEPAEAIGYLMVVLAAVFIAGLPGFFVGLASFHGLTQVGFILVSLHILFPVVIMSMLDNNSVFGPISNDVLTSIKRIPESWMAFYITTGLLLTGLFVVLLVTSLMGSFVGAILRNLVIVFVIFLYMRILGRLGREVGTAINDMERELPVAKDDSAT